MEGVSALQRAQFSVRSVASVAELWTPVGVCYPSMCVVGDRIFFFFLVGFLVVHKARPNNC